MKLSPFLLLFLLLSSCGDDGRQNPGSDPWKGPSERYKLEIVYQVSPIGYDKNLADFDEPWIEGTIVIPKTISDRQRIMDFKYRVEPEKFKNFTKFEIGDGENYGNSYLYYHTAYPNDTFKIIIETTIDLYAFDMKTAEKIKNPLNPKLLPEDTYLSFIDPVIQSIADTIPGSTDIEVVRNIFDYVVTHLKYSKQDDYYRGAQYAALYGEGDCSEFSSLFVNLCRTRGIPTKKVTGIVALEGEYKMSEIPGHSWAVAYLQDYGWVPFDPTWKVFDRTKPMYIYMIDNLKYVFTEFCKATFTARALYGFKIKPTLKITKVKKAA